MSHVKTEEDVRVLQEALDLLLRLDVGVYVRVERARESAARDVVGDLLDVARILCPLLVREVRIHRDLARFEIVMHRREQDDVLCRREFWFHFAGGQVLPIRSI